MPSYRVQHEVRVLDPSSDRAELGAALAVYVRNTTQSLRTLTAQIQAKFERPDNPHGELCYASLREGRQVVGFAMFGYYPARRLIVFDHLAIDTAHRKHGSFFVFASLLQECIEERFPDYDYVVAEIATDPEFAGDRANGQTLVRLLSSVGFGQVHVRYDLPAMDAHSYRRPHLGTLMIRGAQRISEIRSDALLELHSAILFEHYLPWFVQFLGPELAGYERHLRKVRDDLRSRLKGKSSVGVNGGERDELGPRPRPRSTKVLGVQRGTIGHVVAFSALLMLIGAFQAVARLDGRWLAATVAAAAFVYLSLSALSGKSGQRVFEQFGAVVIKVLSRK